MILALLLAFAAITGGTLLTYFYQPRATLAYRLAAGTCTGFALLGIVGFLIASLIGMKIVAVLLCVILTIICGVVLMPFTVLHREGLRRRARSEWQAVQQGFTFATLGSVALGVCLLVIFSFAMYERGGEIFTGFDNNIGDLPFHISIINGFAKGENFPPEHTEFAGVRLTYPFLVDFIAALFVSAGASLASALFVENVLLALAFVGVLYVWARELTGDVAAGRLTVALVLCGGGLGWLWFLREGFAGGFFATLANLSHNYTITSAAGGYRWGNTLIVLLVPQRGLLLGAPLFILAATLLWQVVRGEDARHEAEDGARLDNETDTRATRRGAKKRAKVVNRNSQKPSSNHHSSVNRASDKFSSNDFPANERALASDVPVAHRASRFAILDDLAARRLLAAGVVAGLLPLIHAHSFALLLCIGAVLAVLFASKIAWRVWVLFFLAALVLAVPQLAWVTRESGARAESFIAWQFSWDRGEANPVWFWFKNTWLLIPLLVAALFWRDGERNGGRRWLVSSAARRFYIPFACIFIGANLLKLSPWIWDNIKLLFLWFVASAPFVAVLITHLWRKGNHMSRVALALLVLTLTGAGALDILRVVTSKAEQRVFSLEDTKFAAVIERRTAPQSRILHAPIYNHPSFLTGRHSVMGYPGHLWTHGLDYLPRELEVKAIYAGTAGAADALRKLKVDYIVVSPHERAALKVNDAALAAYTLEATEGAYRLYRVKRNEGEGE